MARISVAPLSCQRLVLAALALVVAIGLVEPLLELPLEMSRNYNEGWNAFGARAAVQGEPLYPDRGATVFNNYPPLSFYVVGGVGRAIGDFIVAGRIVALLSLLVVAVAMAWIALLLTGSRTAGAFAGLAGLGSFTFWFPQYVAMNDPQLLGHALQYVGLVLLLRNGASRRSLMACVVLMLLSGLVKHNLVVVPAAVSLWLFVGRRGDFVLWSSVAAIGVAVVTAGLALLYGAPFFEGVLFLSRVLHVHQFALAAQDWLVPIMPLLAGAAALPLLGPRDPRVGLLLSISGLSLLLGLVLSFAEGISYNAVFDLLFAATICATVTFHACASRSAEGRAHPMLGPFLMAALAANLFAATPLRGLRLVESFETRPGRVAATAADIEELRSAAGPVLCENAALAYWAGKNYEVDFFNYGQRVAKGEAERSTLISRLMAQEFEVVQLRHAGGSARFDESINHAIHDAYVLARTSESSGAFFRPRPAEDGHSTPGTDGEVPN